MSRLRIRTPWAVLLGLTYASVLGVFATPAAARPVRLPPPSITQPKAGPKLPASATATAFSNPVPIVIPDATGFGDINQVGVATPYPSTIAVSGLPGVTSKVTVDLSGLTHTYFGDVDVVLVSPTGQAIVLTAVNGGGLQSGESITLDDAAANPLPGLSGPIASGTYKPTNGDVCANYLDCGPPNDAYPAPGPAIRPTATALSVFNGVSPNGNWNLYAIDRGVGDVGSIAGGWAINIDTIILPVVDLETGLSYSTIQAAINDPPTLPGHHIQVAAGTYVENVNDTKGLHLLGANAGACAANGGARGPESVIDGNLVDAAVTLTSGSSLDGFTIVHGLNGGNAGVVMPASTNGVSVVNNIVTDNTIGIYANSNGPSTVDCNLIVANNIAGPSGGTGIYSEHTQDLTVSNNELTGHTLNNPTIFAATAAGMHTGLKVVANNYHDALGIYCVSVSGSFTGNRISASAGGPDFATSLAFTGACVGVTVNDNFFTGNTRGVRIQDDGYGYGPNDNIKINHNDFTGNTQYAIGLIDGYASPPVDATCNWYGNISGPNAPSNPSGTGDAVVGAVTFQPWLDGSITGSPSCSQVIQHTIFASAGPGGSIAPPGATTVPDGASQAYTITADACAHIADVTVDGGSVGPVSSYTFTNVTADHTIEASFAPNGPYTITTVSTPAAGGSVSGPGSVPCGGTAEYSIAANKCYTLTDVKVDGASQGPVPGYTFTNVQADHTIEGIFTQGANTITAVPPVGGTISPPGTTSVNCGDNAVYSIQADACHTLTDVQVDNVSQGPVASYTFVDVQSNHTISATFVDPTPPTVTVIFPNGGENIIVSGDVKLFWQTQDNCPCQGTADLYISRDNGATYTPIVLGTPDGGSYVWHVDPPGTNSGPAPEYTALFKVVAHDCGGNSGEDVSDAPFSIYDGATAVIVSRLDAEPMEMAIAVKWSLGHTEALTAVVVERAEAEAGPWLAVTVDRHDEGDVTVAVDRTVAPGRTYWYRLVVTAGAGDRRVLGTVSGTAAAPRQFELSAVWPNPMRGAMNAQFTVAKSASVRLSVLDVQGREIQMLARGAYEPGRYQVTWDGHTDRGGAVPAGLYFVRFQAGGLTFVRRLVIAE